MADFSSFSKSLQLYSVRNNLQDNPEHCIKQLAKLGIKYVEGFDLTHLTQLKPLLDDAGIVVKSSFLLWSHITGRDDLTRQIQYPWMPSAWGIEYEIDQALNLGLDTLVNGYLLPAERESLDDFKNFADQLNNAGEKCREAGLDLLYHNHAFEFEPIDGVVPYFYLLENTSADNVNFELDVLWAQLGGYLPAELMSEMGARVRQLHLKTATDADVPHYDDQTLTEEQQDCSLGKGVVDIGVVLNQAVNQEIGKAYIEQECSSDMYASLARSIEYLKNWESTQSMAVGG